ncbi:MAG: hypothetical protein MMC33_007367 [Icmadophila ericetorum]|nr:hypothetical protein [Icmadophila ericetorum]
MSILQNPKLLFLGRIAQLCIAIAFFVLMCWSGAHRGWWNQLNGALAVGAIASIFTFAITAHGIYIRYRSNPFSSHGKVYSIARICLEAFMILLWIGAVGTNFGPKGFQQGDSILQFPPTVTWDICAALGIGEIISFMITTVLVFMEDRAEKANASTYGV